MDRMIYTALNAISVLRDAQVTQAQNLANQSVPGYRRDLDNEGGTVFARLFGAETARAFRQETGPAGFSQESGRLNPTGEKMDIAIADAGYFHVQPETGAPALSRRGDLRADAEGTLRNGAGDALLDVNGDPIALPPYRDVVINELGEIHVTPADGAPGERVLAATIATVVPGEDVTLRKSEDGRIRVPDGELPPPDQMARVRQGVLESSNVNAVEEMIGQIELQRQFELGLKLVTSAKQIDETGARLLRMPGT
ncbi:flagellar basal body rod protein FlgF [Rhodosalinus sediminis]|uniref:flagellar basal body rod protein FlgF n=1 Tax=Rhodosalinus sediminis TaxID=1940533 RepID=UPI0023552681|nr:flagellar hook-basal body complex protein [Rhodosalinus sediminis]